MLIDKIALILVIIGALNWGSVGLFGFDCVARGTCRSLVHHDAVSRIRAGKRRPCEIIKGGLSPPFIVFYHSPVSSSSRIERRNWRQNITLVIATAPKSATGSARKTAKALSAKKQGRM